MNNEKNILTCSVLPDGKGGFHPCPELLTQKEAEKFLRLDDQSNPSLTLRYYREQKKLRATHIGKTLKYSRKELEKFIAEMTY